MEPKTLADIFFTSVTRDSERVIMFKRRGTWENVSSRQYYGYVVSVAHALKQWGIHRGDRVAILSENRPEWMITDFACVCSGIIDVPIYTTLTADQTAYLLQNSGARVVFVSTLEQLRKVESIQSQTSVEKVVVMDDIAEINVIPMWSVLEQASLDHDREFDEAAHNIQLDEIATLIYTSGTTGTSKGVMLSHGNLTSNAVTSTKNFEWADEDLYLSFLPLSHVTARHLDYVCFLHGATVAYCPYFDQLPQMLQEVKPTIRNAMPPPARSGRSLTGRVKWVSATKLKSRAVRFPEVCRGTWPTSSSTPKSARALAEEAASIARAVRRWARTWLNGLPVWAFPSMRATA